MAYSLRTTNLMDVHVGQLYVEGMDLEGNLIAPILTTSNVLCGNVYVQRAVECDNCGNIQGDLIVNGNIHVTGVSNLDGNVNVGGDLTVAGNIVGDQTVVGNLNVTGTVTSTGGSTSGSAHITLSSAQILAMSTGAGEVLFIPAQGANTVIYIRGGFFRLNYNTTTYTGSASLFIGGINSGSKYPARIDGATIRATLTKYAQVEALSPVNMTLSEAAINESLYIYVAGSSLAAGDSTLDVWVNYDVITLT